MRRTFGLFALPFLFAAPGSLSALDLTPRGVEARAGASAGPDQFHLGFQSTIGGGDRLVARPSLDLGLGNGIRLVSLNGDVLYRLPASGSLRPFLGGGPALVLSDVTDGVGEAEGWNAALAAHLLAGLEWSPTGAGRSYLFEARGGFGDTTDLKLTVGIRF